MPRPERAIRTQALILRRRDLGEADRVLTILTPNHGKRDVIARGARKPASTKTGHVELFTRADMLIHQGRDFGIAVQVEMVAPYLELREDLQRGAYASYAVELLDRFTAEGDDDYGPLFTLLDDTFTRLCVDPDPRLAVRYYEMRLLEVVGFRPELNQCVISGEPIHAMRSTSIVAVGMTTLKLLRHMQRSPYEQVRSLKIAPALHEDVERVLLGYITFLLERRLQSVDFIRRVRQP